MPSSNNKRSLFQHNGGSNWDDENHPGTYDTQEYDEGGRYDSDSFDKDYCSDLECPDEEEVYERATKRRIIVPEIDHATVLLVARSNMAFLGDARPEVKHKEIPTLDPILKWSQLFTGTKPEPPRDPSIHEMLEVGMHTPNDEVSNAYKRKAMRLNTLKRKAAPNNKPSIEKEYKTLQETYDKWAKKNKITSKPLRPSSYTNRRIQRTIEFTTLSKPKKYSVGSYKSSFPVLA